MKVVFVHNQQAGGANRVVAGHIGRLAADVHEVCLGTATPVTADATVIPLRQLAPELSPALRPPARYYDLAALLLAWRRAARHVASLRPDIVLSHTCRYLQTPPTLAMMGAPVVMFAHEARRADHEPSARARRRRRSLLLYGPMYSAQRAADRRGVAAARLLLTNSQYTAAALAQAYDRTATVIPLGVADAFVPAPAPLKPQHVLSVGSLIAGKGHELVIAAAGRSRRRWPVVIVAPKPDPAGEAELRAAAQTAGVQLTIQTGISDVALRDLYRTAIATLYLAEAEPLGLVSLEAQACGCPVIVSNEGGLPETLKPGASGWVVPRDPVPAAARLDELDDPALRAAFAARAAAHGAGYTWDASTRALEAQLAIVTGH